jgi:hypothetical protein
MTRKIYDICIHRETHTYEITNVVADSQEKAIAIIEEKINDGQYFHTYNKKSHAKIWKINGKEIKPQKKKGQLPFQMKYAYTEPGLCRVHYKCQNRQGEWIMYCLMEDFDTVKMYRCSMDGEPGHEVALELQDLDFEISPDEYGKKLVNNFLTQKESS